MKRQLQVLQYAIKEDVNIYMYNSYMYIHVYASERMARLVNKVSLTREVFAIIETIHVATLMCKIRTVDSAC